MAHINEIFSKTVKLKQDIENLLTLADCNNYGYLNNVEMDEQDAEQIFLWNELNYIMNRLRDAKDRIEYLSCPVEEIGCLHKNKLGRYTTQNGHTYTSGSRIEALITDARYHDFPYWTRTSIEHNGTDYYLVKHKNIPLEGLSVRVRREAV